MRRIRSEHLSHVVGAVTLAMGTALVVAPQRTTEALGLGDRSAFGRVVGLIDLSMVPGLVRGEPRWPWMAGRAALNLVIAHRYLVQATQTDEPSRARAGAIAMGSLTFVDGALAVALRSSKDT